MGGDHRQVIDVAIRYAYALDGKQWQELAACFTAEAVADYGSFGVHHGAVAIADSCAERLGPLNTQHLLANHVVRLDSDMAEHRCYVRAEHANPDTPGQLYTVFGTYRDRLVRSTNGWRIEYRLLEIGWTAGDIQTLLRLQAVISACYYPEQRV